jgi:hypothetical protein
MLDIMQESYFQGGNASENNDPQKQRKMGIGNMVK